MKVGLRIFLIMTSISILLVVLPSYIIIASFTAGQKDLVKNNLLEKDANTMDKISRLMNERITNLRFLADPTNRMLTDPSISLDDKIIYLKNFQADAKSYSTISIYDAIGIKIGDSENVSVGKNDSDSDFFTKAIHGDIYWDTSPSYQSEFQQYIIHLAGPLKDINNKTIGVIVLNFPMDSLNYLLQNEHYSDDTKIDLLTGDGLLIYSNHDKQILHHRWNNSTIFNEVIRSPNHSVSDTGTDPSGDQEVFAATQSKSQNSERGINWILVVGQKTDVAFSKITDLQNQFVAISLTIFIASVVSSLFFTRMISKPITKLVDLSKRLASGDFSTVPEPTSNDEFGDLIHSFNMTSRSLEQYRKKIIDAERLAAIGQLSARVSHDIRNPVSTIKNAINLIKMQNPNLDKRTLEKFSMIDTAITRIVHQLDEVLNFIVPKTPLLQSTSTSRILEGTVERLDVPEDVKINLPPNDIVITCDPYKIEIVFANLITNAIQAMDNKGTITIKVAEDSSNVVLSIEDTGPGIPKDLLPKIFDPLFTTRQIGTGLGLTSCKNIVEQHGGSIDVKSEIGKGTVFTIRIPKK